MSGPGPEHAREPWWASGGDRLAPEPDPLTAHRAARQPPPADEHEASGRPPGERTDETDVASMWDRLATITRDAAQPDASDVHRGAGVRSSPGLDEPLDRVLRSTVADLTDSLAALLRATLRRARGEARSSGHDPACRSCPWCMLSRSLGDARPEVAEHLEQATRHLVLAARAWVDAAEERTAWEPIPIDDEEQQ